MEEMNQTPQVLKGEMRTDSVPVDEHYSSEGYFYDTPILTRTGIFTYHLDDGTVRRELRRPEDVFEPDSLASYEGKPIIITHDARMVDKDNARRERVGTILTPGQQDGETVRAKVVIDDPDAVKASGLRELSLGYYEDLIMLPGEWNGEPYDAIQTNIRVNHLALVAVARAGEDARLNMDSKDNGGVYPMDENKTMAAEPGAAAPAAEIKKDPKMDEGAPGAAPALDPEGLKAALAAYLSATAKVNADEGCGSNSPDKPTQDEGGSGDPADPLAEITARRDAMEDGQEKADINTLLSMLEAANARADAAEGCSPAADDPKREMNCDSADDIAAKVRQRVELVRLGDRLNLDGMDSLPVPQAKMAVIRKVLPSMRLDGKGAAYIDAAYDIAKEKANARKTVEDQRRQVFNADAANAAAQNTRKNDPDAARNRMIQRHNGEKED